MAHTYTFIAAVSIGLLLTGCGGSTSSSVASPITAPTAAVAQFKNLSIPTSFTWTSQQAASNTSVTVSKTSGSLGNIRVTVSNFIVIDPTGGGGAIPAMATDVLISALGSGLTSSAAISFGKISVPSGTSEVMIEVFSTDDGSRIGGGIVTVAKLLAGSATLAL